MSTSTIVAWRCPACRSALRGDGSFVRCDGCERRYVTVEGIPDLRTSGEAWVDQERDQEEARRLAHDTRNLLLPDVVRRVFESQPGRTPADIDMRTRQVLAAPERLQRDLAGWLAGATSAGCFLDLGCGPGMLLAAAARLGRSGIGVDVSLTWLVVARRLIAHHGGNPLLAAGFAESLPLAHAAVAAVVSLDVIEHVGDPAVYLREIDRVTAPSGQLALSTPNRYSLAPEPHVDVWGVGWLPRRLQRPYVEWRSGKSYAYTRLLSSWEAARLVRRNTRFRARLLAPAIPAEEIAQASPAKRRVARLYNRLAAAPLARLPLLAVGAFYQVLGEKPPA